MMRIAILTPLFIPEHVGGAEISVFNVAQRLGKAHEVFVVTRKQKERMDKNFRTEFVSSLNKISLLKTPTTILSFIIKCAKLRPDLIYAETLYTPSFAAYFCKKLFGIHYIVKLAGEFYVSGERKRRAYSRILNNADAVLPLTNHMKREMERYTKNRKFFVVPEGVNYMEIRKSERFSLPKNTVLYIGRFDKLKGPEYLIKAFAEVEKKVNDVSLIMGGYGPMESELKTLAKELRIKKIKFIGKVKREEVSRYMKSCGVFVLPSVSEGFPLAIAEAMSAGAPIVATNIRGIPEILNDGRNGLLAEPRDSRDLAGKIIKLLKNEKLRKEMSKNNIKDSEKYDWDNIVKDIERIIGGIR